MNPAPAASLPAVGLLAELSEDVRARLAEAGVIEELPVDAYLVSQGQPHDDLTFIISGKLKVTAHAHGDTVQLAEIGPGHTVGEMNVLDPQNASADVVVIEPARVWSISAEALETLIANDAKTGLEIIRVLARELCRRLRQNSETMLKQAESTRVYFRDNDY